MHNEIINFGGNKIKKQNFHFYKNPILLKD